MSTLLRDRGFWIAAGSAFAVVVALVTARAISSRWWGGAGEVATIGGIVGLSAVMELPVELVLGLAMLAAGALVATRWSSYVAWAAVVPGAALVALAVGDTATDSPDWVKVVVGVAAGLAALLCRGTDATRPRLTGLCIAIAALGVYSAVPDTEAARALLGAAGVGMLLGLAPDARPSPAGSAAAVGLIAWNVGVGGWPRPGAVIGGVACVGVLALGPLIRWARTVPALMVAVHIGVVAVVARLAGLREGALAAALIVVVAYAVGSFVLLATARPRTRGRRGRVSPP